MMAYNVYYYVWRRSLATASKYITAGGEIFWRVVKLCNEEKTVSDNAAMTALPAAFGAY